VIVTVLSVEARDLQADPTGKSLLARDSGSLSEVPRDLFDRSSIPSIAAVGPHGRDYQEGQSNSWYVPFPVTTF